MKATAATLRRPRTRRGEKAMTAASPARAERAQKRQLEKSVSWTGSERLRCLWYRLRLTVQEMNYATCRMTELQTRLPEEWSSAGNGGKSRGQRTVDAREPSDSQKGTAHEGHRR